MTLVDLKVSKEELQTFAEQHKHPLPLLWTAIGNHSILENISGEIWYHRTLPEHSHETWLSFYKQLGMRVDKTYLSDTTLKATVLIKHHDDKRLYKLMFPVNTYWIHNEKPFVRVITPNILMNFEEREDYADRVTNEELANYFESLMGILPNNEYHDLVSFPEFLRS